MPKEEMTKSYENSKYKMFPRSLPIVMNIKGYTGTVSTD